ncbi:DUF3017 domain-containing protein [Nonomuraea sp. NPDC050556]|uniref:DUF3017 domain-containing protein n=1 Tax=Nonomuraea sp. NPDC050556 TaxID=3364369 RepID=UPI0037AC2700
MTSDSDSRWGAYPLILVGALVALLVIVLVDLKWGGFALGGVLMLGAVFRFSGYGGQLAVRGKTADVIMIGGLGFVIVCLSMLVDNDALKAAILDLFGR